MFVGLGKRVTGFGMRRGEVEEGACSWFLKRHAASDWC